MNIIRTTKQALRRLLLEQQLLLQPREQAAGMKAEGALPVLEVIKHLECVQIDPVSAVRPNQHLVLAARIPGYERRMLEDLLPTGKVFEYFANAACVIPMEDYPIFEPARSRMRGQTHAGIEQIRETVDHVIARLEEEGPLPAKAFESNERVHGYWDNVNAKTKATSHALNLLMDSAQIRIVGREGNQRLFDIARRSVPEHLLQQAEAIDSEEALQRMLFKYFRAYRVFEPSDARYGWQRLSAAERREVTNRYVHEGLLTTIEVEGLKQPYYILSSDTERLIAHQHGLESTAQLELEDSPISFLPPLDNLLWSRKRLADLFDFEYRWEIYTPAVKRKYGYYAMPILAGDRLIGRIDPRLDDKQKHMNVLLVQLDPGVRLSAPLKKHLQLALKSFAKTHGATSVSVESWVESSV